MHRDFLSYLALALLLGVAVFLIYLLFYLHDLPYRVACRRRHPQRDAIHAACWVSLCVLHVIWPLLFIWAVMHPAPEGAKPAEDAP